MDDAALDVVLKLGSAAAAGSLIGLEREFHGRPAGFRTHALVCLASALLMLVTPHVWEWLSHAPLDTIRTDPTRIAQGIMTGIGFLGAGVIFKEGASVRGLTTAASIWATSAVGILYGIGIYFPAVVATALILGILALFRGLEAFIPTQLYARFCVRFLRSSAPPGRAMRDLLAEHGIKVVEMSTAVTNEGREREYQAVVMTIKRRNIDRLMDRLEGMEGLLGFSITPVRD